MANPSTYAGIYKNVDFLIDFLSLTLRLAPPITFAALGGLVCETGGVATICLEGVLLASAFGAAASASLMTAAIGESQALVLAILIGLASGTLIMLIHMALVEWVELEPILSGFAVNLLASGATPILCHAFFGSSNNTPLLHPDVRLHSVAVPFLHRLPVVGEIFFNQSCLVYLLAVSTILVSCLLYRSRFGFYLRACGLQPSTATQSGISVARTRWLAFLVGGILCSFGGLALSLGSVGHFMREMAAGRGYMALGAVVLGGLRPWPTCFAGLLFAAGEAFKIQMQGTHWFSEHVPLQLLDAVPYAATLLLLIGGALLSRRKQRLVSPGMFSKR